MPLEMNPDIDIEASVEARHRQHHLSMVKIEEDIARYEAVIAKVEPSLIVEIGTFSGRSAEWFARYAPVLTIDVSPIAEVEPLTPEKWDAALHPIKQIVGRSVDLDTVAAVFGACVGFPGPVLVVLDGDHSATTVHAELTWFAKYATYIVVEDTLLRWFPEDEQVYDGNPMDALEAWLPEHPEWTIDREVESMYPVTQFPNGWLKRAET